MKSLNEVRLIGRVGMDPKTQQVGEHTVVKFTLATSKKIGDKETTQWHNVEAWNKLGENIAKYVRKGSALLVSGEIKYNEYEKDGQKRTVTVIGCNDVIFLSEPNKQTNQTGGEKVQYQKEKPKVQEYEDRNDDLPF